jgi:hypothetical protein
MANFREVNKAIRKAFPGLDVQAVRGHGYIYFSGADGFDKVDSVYVDPVQTSTANVIRFVLENIADSQAPKRSEYGLGYMQQRGAS